MELLPLVCLCLLSCSGDAVRVVVEEDSDAVLNCSLSTEEDISGKLFDWRKDGQKEKEVFTHDTSDKFPNRGQDDQFKGRVSFFQDQLQNGNASIKITRTKMADSGNYSCDFPRHQPRQTFIIELVVGLAPEPVINILAVTKDWVLLQCEARGVPPLTVELKNSTGIILKSESTPISETGRPSSITLNIAVTKTDDYSCVATQKQFSHQVTAMIPVHISVPPPESGWSVWWIVGAAGVICGLVAVIILRNLCTCRRSRPNTANGPPAVDSSLPVNENYSRTIVFSDDAE